MLSIEFLRQFRFFGYAIFDLVASFLGMGLLAPLLSRLFRKLNVRIPKMSWIYWTLPIGVITHILVGKFTPMTKNFLDLNSNYILKIIIIGSLVLGFKGVKMLKK